MDEPTTDEAGHYTVPTELEYVLTGLIQPLVVKITDLEVQVTTMSNQLTKFQELVDGLKAGGIAKRLLGVG